MRVIESGDHAAAECVDHAGTRPGQGSDVGLVADGGDAPCGYGERGGLRPGGIPVKIRPLRRIRSDDPAVPGGVGALAAVIGPREATAVFPFVPDSLACRTTPGLRAFRSAARAVRFTGRQRPGG